MSAAVSRSFRAPDVTIAICVALLAQLLLLTLFSLPSPKLVEVDISNDNAQPIAVAITPVLKAGTKSPSAIPSPWQRKRAVAKTDSALPSTQAEKTAEAIPKNHTLPDAGAAPVDTAEPASNVGSASVDAAITSPVASTQGSEQGAENGTETDELKGLAADMYRNQLTAWFLSRFSIRGKIPFEQLKTLHASVTVSISPDRLVTGFSLDHPSGDATFDGEVTSSLTRIQSAGIELPAPPPNYPDILRSTLPLRFSCTIEKLCE